MATYCTSWLARSKRPSKNRILVTFYSMAHLKLGHTVSIVCQTVLFCWKYYLRFAREHARRVEEHLLIEQQHNGIFLQLISFYNYFASGYAEPILSPYFELMRKQLISTSTPSIITIVFSYSIFFFFQILNSIHSFIFFNLSIEEAHRIQRQFICITKKDSIKNDNDSMYSISKRTFWRWTEHERRHGLLFAFPIELWKTIIRNR